MKPFVAEIIGTALLVLLGNGVVANVLLSRTKGNGAGWVVITAGWGMAVYVAAFSVSAFSGAHLNPAVTIALAAGGKFPAPAAGTSAAAAGGTHAVVMVLGYIAAQMIGGFLGAVLVWLFYSKHFEATQDADLKLACFSTAPNIRSIPTAVFCEIVGTFVLVLPIFLIVDPSLQFDVGGGPPKPLQLGLGALGALPVGLLVFAIGMSLGGTTGYAINPARDLAPRIAHFLLPIPGKRDSDWGYAWVPVVGPIIGGILAAGVAKLLMWKGGSVP